MMFFTGPVCSINAAFIMIALKMIIIFFLEKRNFLRFKIIGWINENGDLFHAVTADHLGNGSGQDRPGQACRISHKDFKPV